MTVTRIAAADWAVIWDEASRRQTYRRGVDVVFTEDRILHVGPGYGGTVDATIDGRERMVMPGLVDLHSHLMSENLGRGITEEVCNPALYMSGLYDPKPLFLTGHSLTQGAAAHEGLSAATEVGLAELLLSGVTTICDLGVAHAGWLDLLAQSGIRAYAAPMYRQGSWTMRTGYSVDYAWDEPAGEAAFRAALEVVDAAVAHPCGRLSGMISPAHSDTCTAELLMASRQAAEARGLPLTLHTAQSVWETLEMTRRHGVTPVQWLERIGFLGPGTVLGHAMFTDTHSWLHWHSRADVAILARTGTSVAHCPTVFSRYGQTLEHLGAYIDAGVNMALGTDTQPHNMIEEMRTALVLGRIAAEDVTAISLGQVFHAATIGGARALRRDDLGRIAVGARADLVLVDLANPWMMPVRDPLRSLVFTAADRAIRDVFVAGRQVVAEGKVLNLDRHGAARRLAAAQAKAIAAVPMADYAGRGADDVAPLALPVAH